MLCGVLVGGFGLSCDLLPVPALLALCRKGCSKLCDELRGSIQGVVTQQNAANQCSPQGILLRPLLLSDPMSPLKIDSEALYGLLRCSVMLPWLR